MSDTAWNVSDYPEPPPETPIDDCPGCMFEYTDIVFDLYDTGEFFCEECFWKYLKEDLGAEYVADELKMIHKTYETYMEECYGY